MSKDAPRGTAFARLLGSNLFVSLVFLASLALPGSAQERGNRDGEWRYIWGDAWSTRYSPLDQIDAENFEDLEVAWFWKGDNFGPVPDNVGRSTPIYADGIVYTVAGSSETTAG